MAERPSDPAAAKAAIARPALWFLADREAFLRRFVLRTLMRPPRFRRGAWPRALDR
jgi:hypothetical protein